MSKDRSLTTAVHVLAALGVRSPNVVSSGDLAKGCKTNPSLIRRVLLKLSDHGLVVSMKGKGGGNRLAKTTEDITMKDVYMAVSDSPLFGSFDKEPFQACPVSCNIGRVLTDVYDGLEKGLVEKMGKISLAQIIDDLK